MSAERAVLAGLVLAYLGLACLARANHRFRALPLGDRVAPPVAARLVGATLLAAALILCCGSAIGAAQGVVAFLLLTGLAGIALALLLSVRPRAALAPSVPLLWFASGRRRFDHDL